MSLLQDKANRPRKGKIILTWILFLGLIVVSSTLGYWWSGGGSHSRQEEPVGLGHSIVFLVVGVFFLITGALSYTAVFFTNCLTFNFSRPIWTDLKAKLYLAKIFVPVQPMLGVGF